MNKDSIPSYEEFEALIAQSLAYLAETKRINDERHIIANKIKSYLENEDTDRIATSNNQSAMLVPALYPSYGSLATEQKRSIVRWMYENHPEHLTVVHAQLNNLVLEEGFPVPMTASGYSVRVLNQTTKKEPRVLSGMLMKQVKKNKSSNLGKTLQEILDAPPTDSEMHLLANMGTTRAEIARERSEKFEIDTSPISNITPKALTRDDKARRKAQMIVQWESGATKSSIAKEHGLSAPYVGEILKKHEQQLVRQYRKALRDKPEAKDESEPLHSSNI